MRQALLLVVAVALPAAAQPIVGRGTLVGPGTVVRTVPIGRYDVHRSGYIVSISTDSALVRFAPVPEIELRADQLQVPLSGLEALTATHRRTTPVAVAGGIALAITGFVVGGRAFGNLCEGSPTAGFTCSKDQSMQIPLAVVGGVTGLGLGALAGHLWKSETWEPLVRRR